MTKFVRGPIEGVVIKELTRLYDGRGWLMETFRIDELHQGIKPVMGYMSLTHPGTVRGPHEHKEQTDVFAFTSFGVFELFLWDNRKESPTYGHYMQFFAGGNNPKLVVVPPGVVHGYRCIGKDDAVVLNFPDRLYAGWGKNEPVDEIRHEEDGDSPFRIV